MNNYDVLVNLLPGEPRISEALERAIRVLEQSPSPRRKVIVSIVKSALNNVGETAKAKNLVSKAGRIFKDLQMINILIGANNDNSNRLKASPLATVPKATNVMVVTGQALSSSSQVSKGLASRILKGINHIPLSR